ncbi:hypothetical protein KKF84_16025 [Myxococcota bacterium]|nr:hypothetical protein [Myxococcota bacterium]
MVDDHEMALKENTVPPAGNGALNTAEKPVEKPAEKPAEKPVEKPVEKPAAETEVPPGPETTPEADNKPEPPVIDSSTLKKITSAPRETPGTAPASGEPSVKEAKKDKEPSDSPEKKKSKLGDLAPGDKKNKKDSPDKEKKSKDKGERNKED